MSSLKAKQKIVAFFAEVSIYDVTAMRNIQDCKH